LLRGNNQKNVDRESDQERAGLQSVSHRNN
jgi:hypothetical protein